jgi:hypothetical protein
VDPDDESDFSRYYYLLAKENNLTADELTEFKLLGKLVTNSRQYGDSLRDELWIHAIDEIVAEQYLGNKLISRKDLKEKTIAILKELL